MRASLLSRLKGTFRAADQWLKQTPERSLEQAYEAALMIKAIEDAHFQGKKISPQSDEFSETASAYLKSELSPYLTTVKIRLSEFKLSNPIVNFFSPTSSPGGQRGRASRNGNIANAQDYSAVVLEKLKFIDEVIGKYTNKRASSKSLIPIAQTTPYSDASKLEEHKGLLDEALESAETISDKTGVLPRSILGTISRIQRNLDPKAEAEVIRTFRVTQNKTFISLRFLLLLILFTLGTQILSKSFLVGPFVDHFRQETVEVFLNQDMEGEALRELQRYEDKLRFQHLIGQMPKLTAEQLDLKLKEKADEIATRFRYRSADAIKNLFADFLSLITFSVYLVFSRREVEVLKSFIDEIVYGLSDSAKAFIIILFTDIFVGFHSPHGWEVVLEGAARHLGLPENRDFIFIFIATFPVILDTVFKYWIFRYLNRVSPSAVATLRNMNE